MLAVLRPHPHRGDIVAAAVVLLTLFVLLVTFRMAGTWSDVVRLLVAGAATALVVAMVVQPGSGDETPRPYESVLYVCAFLLALITLGNLADVLGSSGGSGTVVWIALVLIAFCAWFISARNSAIMTLMAALSGVVAVVAFVDFAFSPDSATAFKWILLVCTLVLALVAVAQRDARRRHAVSMVDAAGLTAIALGALIIFDQIAGLLVGVFGSAFSGERLAFFGGPNGWELVLLLLGLGLIGYGSIDRERVPQFLGVVVLALYLFEAFQPGAGGPTLVGWPLLMLLIGGALLAVGLRPRQDLPPEPPVPPSS